MSVDVAPMRPKTARPRQEEGHAAPAPGRTHPPRSLNVVFDPPPAEVGATIDWSGWHITDEEDEGQSPEQRQIIRVLESSLEMLALEQHWGPAYIGADEFCANPPRFALEIVSDDAGAYALRPRGREGQRPAAEARGAASPSPRGGPLLRASLSGQRPSPERRAGRVARALRGT